jgi:outer membrane protein assembly factor BamB
VGDVVFVGSCNGVLHGVDRQTGQLRWTYKAVDDGGKPEFHGRPLVTSDLIVIGSDDRRPDGVGHVYAFDASTLKLRWKYRAGPGTMTDVLRFDRTAYFVTLTDELIAVDLGSGAVQWTFGGGASNPPFFVNSTPALFGDRIIFGSRSGKIQALEARTGHVVWQREFGARFTTSVAAVGDHAYVGNANGRVHRLNASTGATDATLQIEGTASFKIVPAGDSLLVFADESGTVTLKSLPLTLDRVRWTQSAPRPGWSSFAWPYVWKDYVVVGRETGQFVGLRLTSGEQAWEDKVKGPIAGIGGDESRLYLGTSNGTLYGYALPAVR